MNRNSFVSLVLVIGISFSFQQVHGQLPKANKISELKQTDFLPTLEHTFAKTRNSIYCSSFLYAWEEIRNIIKTPLLVDSSSRDLNLVNNSTSYLNTLRRNEYISKGEVVGNVIKLNSEFNKSLPFERPLIGDGELTFDNKKVSSFGNHRDKFKIIEIVYYKDDSDFIIKLSPKDKEHEIIIYMTQGHYSSMGELIADITAKRKAGLTEKLDKSMSWKYFLTAYDIVDIPKLGFNIIANYPTIENTSFKSGAHRYQINVARQRIAFYLNEKGAEMNTEAQMEVVFSEPAQGGKPKLMKFDKPFFLMLKRTDNEVPYFGLWIVNTELME